MLKLKVAIESNNTKKSEKTKERLNRKTNWKETFSQETLQYTLGIVPNGLKSWWEKRVRKQSLKSFEVWLNQNSTIIIKPWWEII